MSSACSASPSKACTLDTIEPTSASTPSGEDCPSKPTSRVSENSSLDVLVASVTPSVNNNSVAPGLRTTVSSR